MINSTISEINISSVLLGVVEKNESDIKFISLEIYVKYNEKTERLLFKSHFNLFGALLLNEELITRHLENYVESLDSKNVLSLLKEYDCKPSDLIYNLSSNFNEEKESYFNIYNNFTDLSIPDGDGGYFEFCFENLGVVSEFNIEDLNELIINKESLSYLIDLNSKYKDWYEMGADSIIELSSLLDTDGDIKEKLFNYLSENVSVYL